MKMLQMPAPTPGAPSNIGTPNDAEARRATRGSSWNRMPGDHGRGSTVRIGTRRAAPRSGRGVLGDDRGQHHGEHDAEIRAASGTPESTSNWSSAVCGCAFASFRSVSSTIWMGWSRSAWRGVRAAAHCGTARIAGTQVSRLGGADEHVPRGVDDLRR